MSWEAWGTNEPDESWVECEYCCGEPGDNGSFYCDECCGQGGHFRDYDVEDYLSNEAPW